MSMVRMGKWLQPLGHIVSAANGRDLSAEDQRQQLEYAHAELYKELRKMDYVQSQLLEALKACVEYGSMTGDDWVFDQAHAAIVSAGDNQ